MQEKDYYYYYKEIELREWRSRYPMVFQLD